MNAEVFFSSYRCVYLPARLQVVENFAAAINRLTIKKLLNKPEYQTSFALLYISCHLESVYKHVVSPSSRVLTVIREYRDDIK